MVSKLYRKRISKMTSVTARAAAPAGLGIDEVRRHVERCLEVGSGRPTEIRDLAASRDGRVLVVCAKRHDLPAGPGRSRLYRPAADGALAELAIAPEQDDLALPRCSPDGAWLACVARAPGALRSAVLLAPLADAGGAPRRIAELGGTVEQLAFSPGGSALLALVADPGVPAAGAQGSGRPAGAAGSPGREPAIASSADPPGRRRVVLIGLADPWPVRASGEQLNVWEAGWCGEEAIAVVASAGAEEGDWYGAALLLLDARTFAERARVERERQLALPCGSPSGATLAAVEGVAAARTLVAGDVLLLDVASGEVATVAAGDVDVASLSWRDDDRLHAIGLRGLDTVAGEIDVRAHTFTASWETSEACGVTRNATFPVSHAVEARAFVVPRQSATRRPSVALVAPDRERTLASLAGEEADAAAALDGTLAPVRWEGRDGLALEGLLVEPAAGAAPHPLLTWIHGGPVFRWSDTWSMLAPLAPLLVRRGYALFFPNPRGSAGRGAAFAAMVRGDMGGEDARDVLTGIDALLARGIADPARLGVLGRSYGGFMTCWLVTQTDRFAAAAAECPVADWISQHHTSNLGRFDELFLGEPPGRLDGRHVQRSPVVHAHAARTPTLLLAGAEDRCTPPGQAGEFFTALRANGVESKLVVYPDEGHGQERLESIVHATGEVVDWFDRHLADRRASLVKPLSTCS